MAVPVEESEQFFDHHTPDFDTTMRERFADLRAHCPVMHSTAYDGFWVLSKHGDIVRALRDPKKFSSGSGIFIPRPASVYGLPTESDEPDHTHYRRPIWNFLTPGAVAGYEPLIRETVSQSIDGFIETGRADVMKQLAEPVPAQITGQFFGFSAEEGLRIYELISTQFSQSFGGDVELPRAAGEELIALMQRSLDEARRNPGDDVSSAIVTYNVDGRTFDNAECLGMLRSAIGGALATTVSAIAYAVYLLWKHPDQRRRLVENPELAAGAVEEVLRMESPVYSVARTVLENTEVEGTELAKGERVLLLYDSANYDDDVYECPEEFRIDRENNFHLAFGQGIHKCVGQHLARWEIRVVIEELVRRIPDYEVVGTPAFTARGGVHTPTDLEIAFPPGQRLSEV